MTLNRTENASISWNALPSVITSYLTAHRARDVSAAITAFAEDAVVVDEGHAYLGTTKIADWLGAAGYEYSFTTEFIGASTYGEEQFDVTQRLEGDFPGGVADLHYRFTLSGAVIGSLVIEP